MQMLNWHALFLVCSTLLLYGCVPTIHDYNYLSFENAKGAKVIKWMNTPPRGVTLTAKVPREYEIRRPDYTIKILRSNELYSKTIYVAIVGGIVPEGYSIKGINIKFRHTIENGETVYGFTPGMCVSSSPSDCKPTTELRFSVFNEHGESVRKETIPFEVKDGGWFFHFDAI